MSDAIYHILVLFVAALGLIHGYKDGLTGQISGVLGLAFGVVGCRVFLPLLTPELEAAMPVTAQRLGGPLLIEMLAASIIYVSTYVVFKATTLVLKRAMTYFDGGMLNGLIGSAFCVVKYMMFVSIAYNLLADYNPDLQLLKYATDRDGNVVEAVMILAPAAFGTHDCDDMAHIKQMEEAKSISV